MESNNRDVYRSRMILVRPDTNARRKTATATVAKAVDLRLALMTGNNVSSVFGAVVQTRTGT